MSRACLRSVMAASLMVVVASSAAFGQLSGRFSLGVIARRIPTTVTGEIKLDTPSEYTMLEFAVASTLDLRLRSGFVDPRIRAAVNTAGLEHFIFSSPFELGNLSIYELQFDRLTIVPEIWIGVPFEAVTDVNNLPNSVIIPPGDPLFVTARATFSASVGGFSVQHLVMLDDVNFPGPSGSYEPLYYRRANQEFGVGSVTSIRWRAKVGWSMTADFGLSASLASKSVKGHSGRGSVTPDSSFLRLSLGGISLGDVSLFGVGVQNVYLGTSFSVATGVDEAYSTRLTLAGEAWSGTRISGSIALSTTAPALKGLTLSISNGPFRVAIALDEFDIEGLSASLGAPLTLGPIGGSWSVRASGLDEGLTGLAAGLTLAQGVFSTSTSITFSRRGDDFGFASWSSRLSFRFSPALVSAQATFGRYGLTRAAITTSVSF